MLIAIIVSILAGVTIVLSRTVNAHLAKATSPIGSTLWNYVIGLAVSLIVLFLLGQGEAPLCAAPPVENWYLYAGGLIGVGVVLLLNVTVIRISSFYMTLLLFLGQVFCGIVLDILLSGAFSLGNLLGGLCVAIGLSINVWIDRKSGAAA